MYSNVSVYEMEVNGVAVMRRRSDSWLNATQILKVAGVDKGKRTKVLEKEILNGEHEKVQGGYGKYQGTWINYNRGVEFCRQFGVEEILRPLLNYDVSNDGNVGLETPTKEQALAAQRRRMYGNDPNMSQSGTYFKNMSNTAASAIQALNRTRMDSPSHMDGRRSAGPRRPSQYGQDPYQSSQQSLHSIASQESFNNGAMMSHGASFADFPNTDAQEPPRKRIRPSPNTSFMAYDGPLDMSMHDGTPTEPAQSFFSQNSQSFMMPPAIPYSLEPLPQPRGPAEQQKQEWLMSLFMEPAKTEFDDDAAFLRLSGEEFEMPIDAKGNTALHWAATLARIPLVKKLLERGFNMRRGNSGGETALVAACQARNNLDQSTFNQLLDLLGSSIEVRDGRGRTLLHHIAVSSAMKGRAAVGRYYLESLLEYTVRQGSQSHNGMNGSQPEVVPMTLARFMNEIVNAQDKAGDTALNLAARTSTTTIIDQLIEVGADATIANRGGLAPVDFGVAPSANGVSQHQTNFNAFDVAIAENESSQKSFEEAGENFVNSLRQMLSQSQADFQTEMKEKQEILDKTNAALRESSSSLKEERARLERLKGRVREQEELEHKIKNHRQAQSALRQELQLSTPVGPEQTHIGEADKGLDHEGQLHLIDQVFGGGGYDPGRPLTQDQINFLSGMERAEVLIGRVNAYRAHNSKLEQQTRELRATSKELEEKYKKITVLCTGADGEKVDELLDSLVQAVVSEQKDMGEGAELGRVRDFLRLVQGNQDG